MKTTIDLPMDRETETDIAVLRFESERFKVRMGVCSWDSAVVADTLQPLMTGVLDERGARMLHSFLTLFLEDRQRAKDTHKKATENAKESW